MLAQRKLSGGKTHNAFITHTYVLKMDVGVHYMPRCGRMLEV